MPQRPVTNPRLGALIHSQRLAAGLSLSALSQRCGVSRGTISKIENGLVNSPEPAVLQAIAVGLNIDPQDLYALAGYGASGGLPTFVPYLRTKYQLSDEAIADLDDYFRKLRRRYGFSEGDDESR